MIILCLSALALAEEPDEEPDEAPPPPASDAPAETEPEEPPARTFTLTPTEALDSALDELDAAIEDTDPMSGALAAELGAALPAGMVASRLRGRFFFRPTLALGGLDTATALRVGLASGHRWWRVTSTERTVAGETRLTADTPLSGATGGAVALSSLAGPWLGPIGLRLGPAIRYEHADYGDAVLDSAWTVGGRAILSAELGPIGPYIGGGVDTVIAGDRPDGIEPIALIGLSHEKGWRRLSGQGSLQQTSQGARWLAGLSLQITPHLPSEES